jgi:hypothetical protein
MMGIKAGQFTAWFIIFQMIFTIPCHAERSLRSEASHSLD